MLCWTALEEGEKLCPAWSCGVYFHANCCANLASSLKACCFSSFQLILAIGSASAAGGFSPFTVSGADSVCIGLVCAEALRRARSFSSKRALARRDCRGFFRRGRNLRSGFRRRQRLRSGQHLTGLPADYRSFFRLFCAEREPVRVRTRYSARAFGALRRTKRYGRLAFQPFSSSISSSYVLTGGLARFFREFFKTVGESIAKTSSSLTRMKYRPCPPVPFRFVWAGVLLRTEN
jgi:hypothetical protein